MSVNKKIENIGRTEDGRWYLCLAKPWMTEYETISIFGNTRAEVLSELKYVVKDTKGKCWQ